MGAKSLTVPTLHTIIEPLDDGQTEEYSVAVVDENGYKVHRIKQVYVKSDNGQRMLTFLIDSKNPEVPQ